MSDFLMEIGVEEIPAHYLEPACQSISNGLIAVLDENHIAHGHTKIEATPRRMVMFIQGMADEQPLVENEVLGPPLEKAYDAEGNPTKAGLGFSRKVGIPLEELKDSKDGRLVVRLKEGGKKTADILSEILPSIISKISFPKKMRWIQGERFSFARPIRYILAILGEDVVRFEVAGIASDRKSKGHHFLSDEWFELDRADFETLSRELEAREVVLKSEERREQIAKKMKKIAGKGIKIGKWLDDDSADNADLALLEEVKYLVEHPGVIKGSFPKSYLEIPAPVLITAMKKHQRYFPIYDDNGGLVPEFISVIDRNDANAETIREGNERVLKARLADALFFWREDLKKGLEPNIEGLRKVVFQEKLGSYYDKVERVGKLALWIAGVLGVSGERSAWIERAAKLMKADLLTHMVGEFPSLQGVMGREYARVAGEPGEVAEAIAEHYQPRYANDVMPQTLSGMILSLADKFDTIAGCFAVGLGPTGSRDPYALRRQGIGTIRIIMEGDLRLKISDAFALALDGYGSGINAEGVSESIVEFYRERIYQRLVDNGFSYDVIRASMASGFDDMTDLVNRVKAIEAMQQDDRFPELVAAVERSKNIYTNVELPDRAVDKKLLLEEEERRLWAIYEKYAPGIREMVDDEDYQNASMKYLDSFGESLHQFFEKVFVNVEDIATRENRMLMLKEINQLYVERVADLALIVRKS